MNSIASKVGKITRGRAISARLRPRKVVQLLIFRVSQTIKVVVNILVHYRVQYIAYIMQNPAFKN